MTTHGFEPGAKAAGAAPADGATPDDAAFEALVDQARARLRPALIGLVGPDGAEDLLAETLSAAWIARDRVLTADNPLGYLFAIARNQVRRPPRPERCFPPVVVDETPRVEPGLPDAMARLTDPQRLAVFLIAGCGWKFREVAELMDLSISSVSTHYDRALVSLRRELGADDGGGDR